MAVMGMKDLLLFLEFGCFHGNTIVVYCHDRALLVTIAASESPKIDPTVKTIPPFTAAAKKTLKVTMKAAKMLCQNRLCPKPVKRDFDDKGAITLPKNIGVSGIGCGNRQFFFSKSVNQFTVQESAEYCCSLGMQEVAFLSKADMLCVRNLYYNISGNAKNAIFFVSYFDYDLNHTFTSCHKNVRSDPDMWSDGEPNNSDGKESCVVVKLCPEATCNVGLADAPCPFGDKFRALCQYEIAVKNENRDKHNTS